MYNNTMQSQHSTTNQSGPLIPASRCLFRPIDPNLVVIQENNDDDHSDIVTDINNNTKQTCDESYDNICSDYSYLFGMPLTEFATETDETNLMDEVYIENWNLVLDDDDDDDVMSYSSDLSIQSECYYYDDLDNVEDMTHCCGQNVFDAYETMQRSSTTASPTCNLERHEDDLKILRNQLWKQSLKISMFKQST